MSIVYAPGKNANNYMRPVLVHAKNWQDPWLELTKPAKRKMTAADIIQEYNLKHGKTKKSKSK